MWSIEPQPLQQRQASYLNGKEGHSKFFQTKGEINDSDSPYTTDKEGDDASNKPIKVDEVSQGGPPTPSDEMLQSIKEKEAPLPEGGYEIGSLILPMTLDEYFVIFLDDAGPCNFPNYYAQIGYQGIKYDKNEETGKNLVRNSLECRIDIKGVPLCKSSRFTKAMTIEKTS